MIGIFTVGLDFAVAFTSPSCNSPSGLKKVVYDMSLVQGVTMCQYFAAENAGMEKCGSDLADHKVYICITSSV
jgi:hypothetical protein